MSLSFPDGDLPDSALHDGRMATEYWDKSEMQSKIANIHGSSGTFFNLMCQSKCKNHIYQVALQQIVPESNKDSD